MEVRTIRFILLFIVTFITSIVVVQFLLQNSTNTHDEYVDLSVHGEIGTEAVTIQMAHQKQLTHRGVWVVITDETRKLLLFTKRAKTIFTCPNTWSFVGEHTKVGESYEQAAVRGIEEEIGIRRNQLLSVQELTGSGLELMHLEYHYPYQRIDHQWVKTYVLQLPADSIRQPDAAETTGFLWVPLNESIRFITHCENSTTLSSSSSSSTTSKKNCRACTDSTNIFCLTQNQTKKTTWPNLADLIVSKIVLFRDSHTSP